jgi:hypothetical protein
VTIRLSGAAKLSHELQSASLQRAAWRANSGTSIAEQLGMNRQWKGVVALTSAFVLAFIIALALHSVVGAVIVLLSTLVVSFVLGISWMRTAPMHRTRRKQTSLP